MFTSRHLLAVLSALALASSTLYLACDETNAVKEPPVGTDSGPPPGTDSGPNPGEGGADAGGDGGPTDCFVNPKTHNEIINACTNAVRITKNPVLPKLLPDGGLPPL